MEWRKPVGMALVFCVYNLTLLQTANASDFNPATVEQQVDNFGVGAKVKMKLAGGQKLHGAIQAIDKQSFVLANSHGPRTVAYSDVAQLKLAERAYRAKQTIDPEAARRVVASLGVGRHAVVKFDGRELHGNIQGIDARTFTIVPDRQTAAVQVPYDHVTYVEKNLSFGATVVLIVAVVAIVAIVVAVDR